MWSHRLQLNTDKTEIIWLTTGRRSHLFPKQPLRVGSDLITPVLVVRDLGIHTDADVSMRSHVMKTTSVCFAVYISFGASAARYLGLSSSHWYRVWCYCGWTIAMQCWQAFHCTLHGACNRWWTWLHGSSSRHQSATTSRRSYASYTAESSMADRLQAGGSGLQMSSWQLAPSYLADELHHPAESEFRRRLRSASSHELSVPPTQLSTYGDRAFTVAAVRIWNSLPQHITSAPLFPVFCSRLKTYFFELCYP